MSRTTKLIAGLLVSLGLWGVGSPGAQAIPMGPAQEAIIRKGAVQAQQAVDAYADKRDRDAYDLFLDLADKLAVDVANFLGVDVNELRRAWRAADVAHQRALWPALLKLEFRTKKTRLLNRALLTVLALCSFPGRVQGLYCLADQIFNMQIHVA